MIALPVDIRGGEWRKVVAWAEARIAEQVVLATDPTVDDRARLIAAVRCDELRALLSAPEQTKRLTEQREAPRATY